MGGDIHTTLDAGEVDWNFPLHPGTFIVSEKEWPDEWNEWWRGTDFRTMERITSYRQDDFNPEDGYRDFVDACDEWWNEQTTLKKKKIWEEFS